MAMLDRIKKGQLEGFKEFVQSMEITGPQTRQQIFTSGVLEDPIYMDWVMKNLKTFDDFVSLPSEEIEKVLLSQDQIISMFAKIVHGYPEDKLLAIENVLPRLMSRFKDELSYLKEVTPAEKDSAKFYLVKTTRKLQHEEKIHGFLWKLPPPDVLFNRQFRDGHNTIIFENGITAAEGTYLKGKRFGPWVHNYDTGKMLAEGDYSDGLKSGFWTFYYGSGAIKAKGKYKSDLKHGRWEEWDRSGGRLEVDYSEGVKV